MNSYYRVDEVGRGPLADSISAAIILNKEKIPERINDSKNCRRKRERLLMKN